MTVASVLIGNVDDDPLNADWLLNANKLAATAGISPAEESGTSLNLPAVTGYNYK